MINGLNKYLFCKSCRNWKYWDFKNMNFEYGLNGEILSTPGTYAIGVMDEEVKDKMNLFMHLYEKYLGAKVIFEQVGNYIFYTYDLTNSVLHRGLLSIDGQTITLCEGKQHKEFVKLCDKMIREYYLHCTNKGYSFANYIILPNAVCGLNMGNAWAY